MKKILLIWLAALCLAVSAPAYFVFAGYQDGEPWDYNLITRLEVSTDNTNWVNYLAEENSGGETLTAAPGDTVYFRLKTWNEGETWAAASIGFLAAFTGQEYLTNTSLFSTDGSGNGDLDEDGEGYYINEGDWDPDAGTALFTLSYAQEGSTADENFQSGSITSEISTNIPEGTVIAVTVTITSANPYGVVWLDKLFGHAYADDSATTTARVLIANDTVAATPAATTTPNSSIVTTLPATGANL